jgi:CheY-like chemotaxis protein
MSSKTILYIEDSPLNIRLVERFLKPYDCKVIGEYYASSGIKRAIIEQPDLIFIDIFLPDSNGFTVYNKLRNQDETRNIPMFAMMLW